MTRGIAALALSLLSVGADAQPAAERRLIGRVVDQDGAGLRDSFVTLRPAQQAGLPELETVVDDQGRFRFDAVPPGAYRVAGHLRGFQPSQSTVVVARDRDTEVTVVMSVEAVGRCPGPFPHAVSFRTGIGESLPIAFLTVGRPGRRPESVAVPPSGSPQCFAPTAEDQVTLDVLGYGEHIIKRAGLDPRDIAWNITIEPSPASRLGRTSRSQVTGQVRGRVFDEQGASIPDASVSFQPVDPRAGLSPFEAVTDSRGRFDFIGVRPGAYRVTGKALGFETTVFTQEVIAGVETEVTVVVRRRD